jgi:hypothetical protein
MARTATTRSIIFSPCSRISDFLGPGYISQGVAQASLANLFPIYPSTSLQVLAQLQRNLPSRNQRAGDKAALPDESAISGVMFKKYSPYLPAGLDVQAVARFFTELFTFLTSAAQDAFFTKNSAAIPASLYTEGKFETGDQDDYCHTEMTLELRLNVVEFYRRCAHFAFTESLLTTWSMLAGNEYDYAVANDLVTELGLSDIKGDLRDFITNRIEWKHNFKVLADRLSNANNTSTMQAPLWMDVYALQLLFFHHERPVIFAIAYGFSSKQVLGRYTAHPQVATLPYLTTIDGLMVDKSYVIPPLFTVVPIISLTVTAFGYLSHLPSVPSSIEQPYRFGAMSRNSELYSRGK